ncbi:hypothetical protein [Streptomyces sp. NRRL S-87]|uniref:hypothetical protein n=1 Tax=Streptomyces sp. NRRL S-87 TaxID=1463920 RepID=UPI0004C17192|nr:hypothetical protein [Streptomyces sp. NRRL S-87]
MRRPTKLIAISALLLTIVGCGSTGAAESASSTPTGRAVVPLASLPETPVRGLAKGLSLPLDAYTYTPKDRYVWQVAIQNQWRTCMRRFGFTTFNPPAVSPNTVAANIDAGMGRRYGISDLDAAKTYGYHLPPIAPDPPDWTPAPGAEEAVFSGKGPELTAGTYRGRKVPKGGCRRETQAVYPMPDTPRALAAQGRAFAASRSDKKVVKAMAAWSSCMKTKGYKLADPFKAPALVMTSITAPTPSPEELNLATADVACKTRVHLIQVWHQAETALQQQEITRNAAALQEDRSHKEQATTKAVAGYLKGAPR